ncbi:MAG: hypothetical protein JSW60_00675 [Thermoplasmatales archaeon]|nr:MAG: hypothetical protein JSW60_00675 [Thermoplasmatales archaeon]
MAVGVICLLMLVSFPMVSGERILYPREEGPYTIYVVGFSRGFGFNGQVDFYSYKWPFWCLNYSQKIDYDFEIFSMLLVNGSLQKIKYPANIRLHGFKGFAPTFWMLNLKLYMGRCRVIGKCDELLVYDDL